MGKTWGKFIFGRCRSYVPWFAPFLLLISSFLSISFSFLMFFGLCRDMFDWFECVYIYIYVYFFSFLPSVISSVG